MKPKTKIQKRVASLSYKIAPMNLKQKEWAYKYCFKHQARRLKSGTTTCLECGYKWLEKSDTSNECRCSNCGTLLSIEDTKKQIFKQSQYFSIITKCKEFQVLRYFYIDKTSRVGLPTYHNCMEVVQHWIAPNGKSEVVARTRNMNTMYYDLWNWSSDLEIRREHFAHSINAKATYPYKHYIAEVKRNGFDGDYHGIYPNTLLKLILSSNKMETLLKSKQFELLNHFSMMNHNMVDKYWNSIKICIRNSYIVTDASVWCDYIDLLKYFEKDIFNAKYACPTNLSLEHDRYLKKKREYQRKQDIERMRIEMLENEEHFQKDKSKFFDITFSDEEINIEVLDSIQAYFDEGTRLHHCVHTNKYFLKEDTIILSAKKDGVSIETIEVSLKNFNIVQSRGLLNQNSEYHDKIIELVSSNIYRFQDRMIV